MKKGLFAILFALFLLIPTASASVVVTGALKDTYNIGEQAAFSFDDGQ